MIQRRLWGSGLRPVTWLFPFNLQTVPRKLRVICIHYLSHTRIVSNFRVRTGMSIEFNGWSPLEGFNRFQVFRTLSFKSLSAEQKWEFPNFLKVNGSNSDILYKKVLRMTDVEQVPCFGEDIHGRQIALWGRSLRTVLCMMIWWFNLWTMDSSLSLSPSLHRPLALFGLRSSYYPLAMTNIAIENCHL